MKWILKLFVGIVLITVIFGTIYVTSNTVIRLGANDPQIQMAEDAAVKLDNGTKPQSLVGEKVDIDASLAPFVIIYDKSGIPVASSGYLNGSIPIVPFGVLSHSKPSHPNRITWQPSSGVRIASVTASSKNFYVLSGRNLREVEGREDVIFKITSFGWLITLAVISTVFMFKKSYSNSSKR